MQASNSTFINVEGDQYNIAPDKQLQELIKWLSPLNFNEQQDAAFGKRTGSTGTWILQSSEFKDWMDHKSRVLWCPGKPGVGKTILASIVINHIQELFETDDEAAVVFIYCNHKSRNIVLHSTRLQPC